MDDLRQRVVSATGRELGAGIDHRNVCIIHEELVVGGFECCKVRNERAPRECSNLGENVDA